MQCARPISSLSASAIARSLERQRAATNPVHSMSRLGLSTITTRSITPFRRNVESARVIWADLPISASRKELVFAPFNLVTISADSPESAAHSSADEQADRSSEPRRSNIRHLRTRALDIAQSLNAHPLGQFPKSGVKPGCILDLASDWPHFAENLRWAVFSYAD